MRNKGIDGIKGVGCFVIAFMWHYRHFGVAMPVAIENMPIVGEILRIGFEKGWLMVEIFFILSGYVIAVGYKQKIAKISFREFMGKRIMYLWPLMVTTLLFVTIMQYAYLSLFGEIFVYSHFDFTHFLLNFFMLDLEKTASFNGPSWYVCVLFVLYMIYFFIAKLFATRNTIYDIVTIAIIIVGYLLYNRWGFPVARGMICFFLGVILHEIIMYGLGRIVFIIWGVGGIILLLGIIKNRWVEVSLQSVVTFYFGPLLLLGVCSYKLIEKICGNAVFVLLGKCSFGIYLWHFPIQLFMFLMNRLHGNRLDFASAKVWILYCMLTVLWVKIFEILRMYRKKIRGRF